MTTVLYVEDEALISLAVADDLRQEGFDVVDFMACDSALEHFKKDQNIDILVTDINTPGAINGWDLAIMARVIKSSIPVIYTTAFSLNTEMIVSEGVYLSKPFTKDDLMKTIHKLLPKR